MPKKKNRSANVARKREKRNLNQRYKQKQKTVEKQRRMSYGKSNLNEEKIIHRLKQSANLIEEPEFDDLFFDHDLLNLEINKSIYKMFDNITSEMQEAQEIHAKQEKDTTKPILLSSEIIDDFNNFSDEINKTIIPKLITPDFRQSMLSTLNACKKRLFGEGEFEKVEIVEITIFLFQNMNPYEMAEHPLIQDIGTKTIRKVLDQPELLDNNNPKLQEELRETILKIHTKIKQINEKTNQNSDTLDNKPIEIKVISQSLDDANLRSIPTNSDKITSKRIPDINSLPAKALYKNNDGLEIKEIINEWQGWEPYNHTQTQLYYYNEEKQLYISVTNDRLILQALSEEELTDAMKELETQCQTKIIYLAKTHDEGGIKNGTE